MWYCSVAIFKIIPSEINNPEGELHCVVRYLIEASDPSDARIRSIARAREDETEVRYKPARDYADGWKFVNIGWVTECQDLIDDKPGSGTELDYQWITVDGPDVIHCLLRGEETSVVMNPSDEEPEDRKE